jgi:hypothetical protein
LLTGRHGGPTKRGPESGQILRCGAEPPCWRAGRPYQPIGVSDHHHRYGCDIVRAGPSAREALTSWTSDRSRLTTGKAKQFAAKLGMAHYLEVCFRTVSCTLATVTSGCASGPHERARYDRRQGLQDSPGCRSEISEHRGSRPEGRREGAGRGMAGAAGYPRSRLVLIAAAASIP